jgi:hypothetical protein
MPTSPQAAQHVHQLGAFHAVDAPGVIALGLTILLVRAARYLGAHPR